MTTLRGRKRRLVQIAIVAFGLALALVFLRPETLIAGRPVFSGATDSFRYSGRVENSGEVALVVSADWHDPQALQTYLAANLRRGERLIAQGGGALVPVQITFARPLALEEVRALVAQTGFQVESFILVGRSTLTQQRGGYGRLASSLDGDILPSERELVMDPATGDRLVLHGFMVLEGAVPASEDGLRRWLNHPAVYLVDTSEVEVLEVARSAHASVVADRVVQVAIESPFWSLDW